MAAKSHIPSPALPVDSFAREHAARLLDRLHKEAEHAMEKGDDDSIHDLRVAIRRFTRCLRTFSAFFPKTAVRKIKTALSAVMDTAGTVRDRDITGDLLKDLGVEKSDLLIQQLRAEREVRRVRLLRALHKFQQEDHWQEWRVALGLVENGQESQEEANGQES